MYQGWSARRASGAAIYEATEARDMRKQNKIKFPYLTAPFSVHPSTPGQFHFAISHLFLAGIRNESSCPTEDNKKSEGRQGRVAGSVEGTNWISRVRIPGGAKTFIFANTCGQALSHRRYFWG